jgi:hypothetical protein
MYLTLLTLLRDFVSERVNIYFIPLKITKKPIRKKPILFVRRKRSRSILYSISANMQWVAWAISKKEE